MSEPRTPIPEGYEVEYAEIVEEAKSGYEGLRMAGLVDVLVREILELQARLDRLEADQ